MCGCQPGCLRVAPEPRHRIGEEHAQDLGGDLLEGEPGVEVDVMVDELAQPHEQHLLERNAPPTGRPLHPEPAVRGVEPSCLRGESSRRLPQVGHLRGAGARCSRVDVRVAGLVRVVHRVGNPGGSDRVHPGQRVGVPRQVSQDVSATPTPAQ